MGSLDVHGATICIGPVINGTTTENGGDPIVMCNGIDNVCSDKCQGEKKTKPAVNRNSDIEVNKLRVFILIYLT